MGQISVKTYAPNGSLLNDNQHYEALKAKLSEITGKRIFDRTAIAYLLHIAVKSDLY